MIVAVKKGCNITWGYVALEVIGGGVGSVTSFFFCDAQSKSLKNSEQVYRIGLQVSVCAMDGL